MASGGDMDANWKKPAHRFSTTTRLTTHATLKMKSGWLTNVKKSANCSTINP